MRIKLIYVFINLTKVCIYLTKVCVNLTKVCINPTIVCIKLNIVCIKLIKVCIKLNKVCIKLNIVCINLTVLFIYYISLPLHQPANKKYMEQKIGQLILSVCRRKQVPVHSLAAHLNIHPKYVYAMLNKDDIKISRLRAISIFLHHNFFEDYHPSTQNPGDDPTPLYAENQRLKRKIALLEADLRWYHKNYGLPKISYYP